MDITTLEHYTVHLSVCGILGIKPENKPANISFEDIYAFSKGHMIECSVFYAVEKLEEKPAFWDEWAKYVSQMSAADAIQQIEFERLCDCFSQRKISFISLKGFAVKECYPSSDMRRMSDLDIYVVDEKAAHEAMLLLGYECESFGKCHHNTYFLKPVMNVEIHNSLSSNEKYAEYFEKICDETLKASENYRVDFDADNMLCFMVYHTYKHFSGGGCGIRVVLDLYLYTKKHKNEIGEKFYLRVRELGLEKFYHSLINLGKVWFEGKEPTPLDEKLCEYVCSNFAYGKISTMNRNVVVKNMDSTNNETKAKRKSVFEIMFPDVGYMKKQFPYANRCVILLPFAYVHRAFRAVFVNKKMYKLSSVAKTSNEEINESYEFFKELGI